jgi:hypothetical protein
VVALAGVALAQGPVDEDGDGICDVCGGSVGEGAMRGPWFNRDGEAPWQGRGSDQFVDEDGDGVCDVCGGSVGEGTMRGPWFNWDGEAPWQGRESDQFVDEDGDGVCDNHPEDAPYAGQGGRMGRYAQGQ